jgi:5-(carboxyamino)imidazole ribonucleotide synthase
MGHLNITGASVAQVRETTEQVLALLGLPSMQALAS